MVTVGARSSEPEPRSQPPPVGTDPSGDIHDSSRPGGPLPHRSTSTEPELTVQSNLYVPSWTNVCLYPCARSASDGNITAIKHGVCFDQSTPVLRACEQFTGVKRLAQECATSHFVSGRERRPGSASDIRHTNHSSNTRRPAPRDERHPSSVAPPGSYPNCRRDNSAPTTGGETVLYRERRAAFRRRFNFHVIQP